MVRRHFSSPVRRTVRRETEWIGILPTQTILDNASALIVSLNAAALALRPFTVIRTHLEVLTQSDQSIATENYIGALGAAVVSDQAASIGVTAVPTPETDDSSDLFFVHQYMLGGFDFKDGTGFQSGVGDRYQIDSKAMRKVNGDQDIVIVLEGATLGDGMLFTVAGRMLLKLH